MQNQLVLTGKFLGAKPTQFVGQNNYPVREFYVDITDNPQYPNTPGMQLRGDKVNLVDNLTPGTMIQVKFNLNGRKYVNKEGKDAVATNLDVWKIEVLHMQSAAVAPVNKPSIYAQPAPAPVGPRPVPVANAMPGKGGGLVEFAEPNDDLPF